MLYAVYAAYKISKTFVREIHMYKIFYVKKTVIEKACCDT